MHCGGFEMAGEDLEIVKMISWWSHEFSTIGTGLSVLLIILGGIIYGLAQTQPAESRGKWQSAAMGLIIGGIVMAVIVGTAYYISNAAGVAFVPKNATGVP